MDTCASSRRASACQRPFAREHRTWHHQTSAHRAGHAPAAAPPVAPPTAPPTAWAQRRAVSSGHNGAM